MKRHFSTINLSTNEAIVLQQLHEDGEDDMETLQAQLGMSRNHFMELLHNLKQKGLLIINRDYHETWVSLSRKGNQLISYMWPETQEFAA